MAEVVQPLRYCRYYKGEDKCPFPSYGIDATYWELERSWVNLVNPNEDIREGMVFELAMDFPYTFPYIDAPTSLKAFMYNRFYQFHGEKEGFENFLKTYVNRSDRNLIGTEE